MKMLARNKVWLILSTFLLLSFAFNLYVLKPSWSEQLSCTDSNAQAHCVNVIFRHVENSVVQITRKIPNPTQMLNPQAQNNTALGSGFIYDKQGHIITNNHVVGDAKIVDVTFVDGNRYTAKVIGADIYSDIAVLQIIENITQQPSFTPLILGNSSKLEV